MCDEAVVMAHENEQGQNELCAYVVAEGELTIAQLRGELSQTLPSYMIPAHFVQLEKLPLTPNGKIDRKALPAPDGKLSTGVAFVAPRNETEQALAEIWQALLKAERVGVYDNFFDLGGDSIKAIQVMSRLHARGLKLEMRQLFQFPILGEAALQIRVAETRASQEPVEGEVGLIPIQRWFFEAAFRDAHHWNQSVMLHSDSGFDERIVRDVWTKLTGHHDALRTVYRNEAGGVMAWNRGLQEEGFRLTVMDLTEESDPAPRVEAGSDASAKQPESQRRSASGPGLVPHGRGRPSADRDSSPGGGRGVLADPAGGFRARVCAGGARRGDHATGENDLLSGVEHRAAEVCAK